MKGHFDSSLSLYIYIGPKLGLIKLNHGPTWDRSNFGPWVNSENYGPKHGPNSNGPKLAHGITWVL